MPELDRHADRLLVLLSLLAALAWAVASGSAVGWVLGPVAVGIAAAVTRFGRVRPMSPVVGNVVLLVALLYLLSAVPQWRTHGAAALGAFLDVLLVVKILTPRRPAGRDDAQVLVITLVLVILSALRAASGAFALTMAAYAVTAVHAWVWSAVRRQAFEAKGLAAAAGGGGPAPVVAAAIVREGERQVRGALRRMSTALLAGSAVVGVVVFVMIPRTRMNLTGTNAILGGPTATDAAAAGRAGGGGTTGFSDRVSFDQVARILEDRSVAAYLEARQGDQPILGTRELLLRGTVLDTYTGASPPPGQQPFQWVNTVPWRGRFEQIGANETLRLSPVRPAEAIEQRVQLQPIVGSSLLFAAPGPVVVRPERAARMRARNGRIELERPPVAEFAYTVVSAGVPLDPPAAWTRERRPPPPADAITDLARRPEVSGVDDRGAPLARQRPADARGPQPVDAAIAKRVADYVRARHTYTLDVPEGQRPGDGTDPLANFLLRSRRGHCVHFAGAAALMCQRLGLTARVAVGYRASEFNRLTGQYVVRQSDAHAWIEVLTTTGWQTFDPTPPNDEDAGGTGAFASAYAGAEHAVDYVRWAYATYVAGFSADQQRAIAGGGQQWMEAALARSRSVFNTIAGGDTAEAEEAPSSGAARFSTYAVAAGGAGGVAWLLWRIARQRGRLAKKKATASDAVAGANGTAGGGVDVPFYDELARVLERHAVTAGPRPPHLTPLEFYGRLPLPDAAATVVRRLTMLFYRVRFGNGRLTAARQARLANTVEQLDRALATPAPGAAAPAGADGQLPSPA